MKKNLILPTLGALSGLPAFFISRHETLDGFWSAWNVMANQTATILLLLGVALLALQKQLFNLTKFIAVIVILVTLFTLFSSLSIKMANTLGVSFILLAMALIFLAENFLKEIGIFIAGEFGAFALILGVLKLFIHFCKISSSYDPSSLLYMTVPGAFGIIFIGGSIILTSLEQIKKIDDFWLKSFRLSSGLIFLSLVIWQTFLNLQIDKTKELIKLENEKVTMQISDRFQSVAEAIERFATRLEYFGINNREYFALDSESYLNHYKLLRRIALVNFNEYKVFASYPESISSQVANYSHMNNPIAVDAFEEAKTNRTFSLSSLLTLQTGELGLIISSPIFKNGQILAYVYGDAIAQEIFTNIINRDHFNLAVKESNKTIFNNDAKNIITELADKSILVWSKANFEIIITPTNEFILANSSKIPHFFLFFSLVITCIISYYSIENAKRMKNEVEYLEKEKINIEKLKRFEHFNLMYKTALDRAAIVAITDKKGKIIYVNKKFCEISEYEEFELIGQDHRLLNSGKMGKEFFKKMWKTILGGDTWNGEICNRSKSGRYYWVDTTIIPFFDSVRVVNQFVVIRHEITERKHLEEKLAQSHSLQNAILSSANFSIISTDLKGVIITFNKKAEELLGYSAEEVIGKKQLIDFHTKEEIISRANELSQTLGADITFDFKAIIAKAQSINAADENNWTFVRKDGRHFFVRLSVTALNNIEGKATGYLAIAEDITDKLKQEKELIDGKNRLQTLLELASDGVHILDENGFIVDFSQSFAKMLGYSKEEIYKLHVADWDAFLPKEDIPIVIRKLLEGGSTFETKHRRKDGSIFEVEINAKGIKIGEKSYLYASSRDITERKAQINAIKLAEEKALLASQAKSEFLSTMSHEIRTPLNGVIGMTEILLDASLNSDQKEIAQTIASSGKMLLSIINDVLDFSKIEAGKMELENIEFHHVPFLAEILRPYFYIAEKKGLRFDVNLEPIQHSVYGDPGRIGQIVNNLISNALKFTKEGKISVDVSYTIEGEETLLKILIKDTGIGISDEAKEKMFQSFTQAEQSTTRKFGGTGLGLSISKKLVTLMNGTISFESQLGMGTEFKVLLRLKSGKKLHNQNVNPLNELNVENQLSGRILVAEDNQTNQIVISRMLKKIGLDCRMVTNGLEVLSALKESHFDLILMDCQMPEMDGYQATEIIRKSEDLPKDIPIIALTANALQGDRQKCLDAGMNAHLAKPIDKNHLYSELEKFLKGARNDT